MEHRDFVKIVVDYGRTGSVICHYAANDVVRSTALFRVKACRTEYGRPDDVIGRNAATQL
jgi:hypothetical protein